MMRMYYALMLDTPLEYEADFWETLDKSMIGMLRQKEDESGLPTPREVTVAAALEIWRAEYNILSSRRNLSLIFPPE